MEELDDRSSVFEELTDLKFHKTSDEYFSDSFEVIHEKWRENHIIFQRILKETKFPFFGLHGTSKINANAIFDSGYAHCEIATFYEKQSDEVFLYALYAALDYVSSYALKDKSDKLSGGILVFDVESKGRNETWEYESLYTSFSASLEADDQHTRDLLSRINTNTLDSLSDRIKFRRASIDHISKDLSECLMGTIPITAGTPYLHVLLGLAKGQNPHEHLARHFMAERLYVQKILDKLFFIFQRSQT